MRNKRGEFEFSFAWIFAILAGVFIVSLAIYGVIKFTNISKTEINAQTTMSIAVLTNPLESSFESAKRSMILTNAETRIYTSCSSLETISSKFGKQIIRTSEKTYNKWSEEEGFEQDFQNKYMFSKDPIEGNKFYVFSKPFEMPFKIADLIYITSTRDKYCFVNPTEDIEDELEDLIGENPSENENFFLANRERDCPEVSTTICFRTSETSCDISVSNTYVQKSDGRVYYIGDSLMYAAIFSDKEEYECQLKRLMNRAEQLFEIYQDKSNFVLQETGCNSELDFQLIQMLNLIKGFESSEDVSTIMVLAQEMENINENAKCKLW